MRFEGERKAGCSEQNCRSISVDLLRRLRGRVPQCSQPARISSRYKILFSEVLHKYPAQALYGTVVFVMVGQAVRTIQIQSNPQVMSLSLSLSSLSFSSLPGDVTLHSQCPLLLGRLHTLELG